MNLVEINNRLKDKTPKEIIQWALSVAKRPIVTRNFRPLEATILHAVSYEAPDIPVVWCDSGYNTPQTYKHANRTIDQLKLNVDLYVPQQSVAHRNVTLGIPEVDTPEHDEFTKQVKLEPFSRAMKNHQPDVWFTNLRKDQTAFRANLDIVTQSNNGMLKVCPFFYWTDPQLHDYVASYGLETEDKYYDPTKALANRECGLHT
ncbi:MAG: phosphoadenosine phosphosulfate reductase family protein [Crocinitomicaceae bacterium]|nr:phosphoadenosine phosphosulfate reductase family protein [Crocinitomicaceae bacterium]